MSDFHSKDAVPFCACKKWRAPTIRAYAMACSTCGRIYFVEPRPATGH